MWWEETAIRLNSVRRHHQRPKRVGVEISVVNKWCYRTRCTVRMTLSYRAITFTKDETNGVYCTEWKKNSSPGFWSEILNKGPRMDTVEGTYFIWHFSLPSGSLIVDCSAYSSHELRKSGGNSLYSASGRSPVTGFCNDSEELVIFRTTVYWWDE